MSHAQFVVTPPVGEVHSLFTAATGCPFHVEVSWSQWKPLDPDSVFCFIPYIRPCHQKILMETGNSSRNPCAFLRQLLRPHGFGIEYYRNKWTLKELKADSKTVGKKEGTVVEWGG